MCKDSCSNISFIDRIRRKKRINTQTHKHFRKEKSEIDLNWKGNKLKNNLNIYHRLSSQKLNLKSINLSSSSYSNIDYIKNHCILSNPITLNQKSINTKNSNFNKIFTSNWIDNNNIIFGTKDNKLILFNTNNKLFYNIKLPNTKLIKKNRVQFIKNNYKKYYSENDLFINISDGDASSNDSNNSVDMDINSRSMDTNEIEHQLNNNTLDF